MKNNDKYLVAGIFLKNPLGYNEKNKVFHILRDKGFYCEDYESEPSKLIDPVVYYEKYQYDESFPLIHENDYGAIAFSTEGDFISFGVEKENYLEYLIKLVEKFIHEIDDLEFAYIDYEGDPPKKMSESIKKQNLNWLFMINFFGSNFLEKFGKDFFSNLPFSKKNQDSNKTLIVFLANESGNVDPKEVKLLKKFNKEYRSKIKIYKSNNHEID